MLARLVGGLGVMTDVPHVAQVEPGQLSLLLGGFGTRVVAAGFTIEGDLHGHLWWVLPVDDARRLGARLLNRPSLHGRLSSDERSALAEAANIVASACCSALAQLLKGRLLPSTPHLQEGDVGLLLGAYPATAAALALDVRFQSTDAPTFGGQLILMFDAETVQQLFSRLNV